MADSRLEHYRETIAHSVVFDQLAGVDLDRILAHCQVRDLETGQVVLSEGQLGDGLYVILEGRMEIILLAQGVTGGVRLNTLGPGRCFGEYGLIDDSPCSATVRALVSAKACFLPREDFRRLVEGEDRIARVVYGNLLRFLIGRLRDKDQELELFLFVEPAGPAEK